MFSEVKYVLKNYAENTTIRGIPRFVKVKDRFLKMTWLMFLLACTSTLVFFLCSAIEKFNTWPVITKYGEMKHGNISFPDVTICNLDSFAAGYPEVLPIENYLDVVGANKVTITQYLIQDRNFSYNAAESLFSEFYSIPGYILNLPKDYVINFDCPAFILECNIYSIQRFDDDKSCLNNFKKRWNRNYYACYTLQASKLKSLKDYPSIRGINLLLNVGPPNVIQIPYKYSFPLSQARGVRVSVHSPGTPPNLKKGFSVTPGTENIVTIVQTEKTRLGKPYNENGCAKDEYSKVSPKQRYTRDSCADFCKQENIYEKCGCVSNYLDVPSNYAETVDACGNFSQNMTEILKLVRLNASTVNDLILKNFFCSLMYLDEDCKYICLSPCKEMMYDTFVSAASWPQYSVQLDLFDTYIRLMNCTKSHPSVRERYRNYVKYFEMPNQTRSSIAGLKYNISTSELTEIEKSLLTIKFLIKENVPFYDSEEPAYTSDTMIGVVGGILSLWLGISTATAVELFELVYKLVKCFIKSKDKVVSETANSSVDK
ncbi:hypothetical protein HELRODRAFT_167081 [Helobdella robusta]|uniref:Uncharacterized protein n=1 Tax=Helobdella robusta TaxID=6412 RepID=T1EZ00_HELRO|nr:hypothetical protein HELRODRAFT_167081 [Helobdella robusta]ESO10579.1 hypothetical protein HELRODRAFT_167081 [Helobdella robusta]